ncbi:uncharacterized protein PG986_004739 [Apiospora aurea]|uniref:DUF7702 domain-containing protein n=1 Tax=Apiospora aurea TaxID=335848 RepID=A0ABR1QNG8_9PEZI
MTADALPTATLAVYAVLSIPAIFCLVWHGKTGLIGWSYLQAFCTLRIVGGALAMSSDKGSSHNNNYSSSASLIANIGLSPLLLATSGILHESVAILAAGTSGLQSATASKTDLVLVSVCIALLTAAWVVLCIWTALSLMPSSFFSFGRRQRSKVVIEDAGSTAMARGYGSKLLWGVAAALPFIGIRVFYSLVALTTRLAYLSPSTGALSIRVVVAFLPELVACLILIFLGLMTRHVASL